MACNKSCGNGNNLCCLECPDNDECRIQCCEQDAYEFYEECPDYVQENKLECYLHCPCPAMVTKNGKDYCTKEEGECEYQIINEVEE